MQEARDQLGPDLRPPPRPAPAFSPGGNAALLGLPEVVMHEPSFPGGSHGRASSMPGLDSPPRGRAEGASSPH